MKLKTDISEEIVNLLTKYSILRKGVQIDKVDDIYDAQHLLKRHINENLLGEIWPEDIGTDQDADEDYVNYLKRFESFTNNELEFPSLNSKMNGDNVEITFKHKEKDISWKFEQYSDHFNTEFLDNLFEHSKTVSENQLMRILSDDAFEFAYVPNEIADFFNRNGLYE
jgi:hypothetical protein